MKTLNTNLERYEEDIENLRNENLSMILQRIINKRSINNYNNKKI